MFEINIKKTKSVLNETESMYLKRFLNCIEKGEYAPKEDEIFCQCLIEEGEKYYNSFLFVSNYCKVISVSKHHLKVRSIQMRKLNGKYVCNYVENYYRGKRYKIRFHRLLALYFLDMEDISLEDFMSGKYPVHHEKIFDPDKTVEENDNVNYLQIQKSTSEHSKLHQWAKDVQDNDDIVSYCLSGYNTDIPVYHCTQQQFYYLLYVGLMGNVAMVNGKNPDNSNSILYYSEPTKQAQQQDTRNQPDL